jgi:hypothetical protein
MGGGDVAQHSGQISKINSKKINVCT